MKLLVDVIGEEIDSELYANIPGDNDQMEDIYELSDNDLQLVDKFHDTIEQKFDVEASERCSMQARTPLLGEPPK